jgi:hypothetical protein
MKIDLAELKKRADRSNRGESFARAPTVKVVGFLGN